MTQQLYDSHDGQVLFPPSWQDVFNNLSPLCTRREIAKTCNIAIGTLANHDSRGTGIDGKKQMGKAVVYPRYEAVLWLMQFTGEAVGA